MTILLLTLLWSRSEMALGIVGGDVVSPLQEQQHPWHVALVHYARYPKTKISRVYCGGVLATWR